MLIQLRIRPGQFKLRSVIEKIRRDCHIHPRKTHRVPHLTLYGTFRADKHSVPRIIDEIETVGRKYDKLSFVIDGFRWIEGEKGKVVYFNVVQSKDLEYFRKEVAEKIYEIAPHTVSWDRNHEDFRFHITLAYRLHENEFRNLWSYLQSNPVGGLYLPLDSLRITFLGDTRKIICEYDMAQKKILRRHEALRKQGWKETFAVYRQKNGLEVSETQARNISGSKIYFISDLHFDHDNIIKYCARPFVDAREMNKVLLKNWNSIIGSNDTIYFLGDMSFGRGSHSAGYWVGKLNGTIIFIKGNHDRNIPNAKDYQILEHGKYRFLIVHDPEEPPIQWDGWIIHGDRHNNDLRNYPFVNAKRKTINVSAEVVNYKPVSLEYLVSVLN